MKVTLISCGTAANESELKAYELLKNYLQSTSGDDKWFLLTNLAFSVTNQLQSDEIDIVAIGPPGVRLIEIKHWTPQWVDSNLQDVEHEADKVTNKARKLGTTLRKRISNMPYVDGVILLTRDPSQVQQLNKKVIRGVSFNTLNGWKAAIGLDKPSVLTPQQIESLANILTPKNKVAMDGSIRRFAGYINLELQTPRDERFHRIYKGIHSTRQDRVILHIYDLSASDDKHIEAKARREFETLHRLQLHSWAPRILDSYQSAPGYVGEIFFFTMVDPVAPSIADRVTDEKWDTRSRLAFTQGAISALIELHQDGGEKNPLVHRSLNPRTILVKHDNSPILTGFDRTKIPSSVTVASSGIPQNLEGFESIIAPEVRAQGFGIADQRSDVYSLCASLCILFKEGTDDDNRGILDALSKGLTENPLDRCTLEYLNETFSKFIGESTPRPIVPPARFWTEDQVVSFHGHDYRIVSRLGSGGVGITYKVVEIDRLTKEDLGTYVAKIAHDSEVGQRILKSYLLARSHLHHTGLSVIYEVAHEWQENEFLSLMTWIDGAQFSDFTGIFPLLAEEQQEVSSEALAIRWLGVMCEAISVLHRNGLVHGDISPRNIIVSGNDLVLTDYDFVKKIGTPTVSPGTVLYCSPSNIPGSLASASDDFYALAASFFHVIFDKEPFLYGGHVAKERGIDWEEIDRTNYPTLATFIDKATNPDVTQRFFSADEAIAFLTASQLTKVSQKLIETMPSKKQDLHECKIEWLKFLLQSYPGSQWGNMETRGLDTPFANQTYVSTQLEETLERDIKERRVRLVILCGNAGDGKTALLQHLAIRLGFGTHTSSKRILKGKMKDGLIVQMNLDGSAAWHEHSADEILDEFLTPFYDGPPDEDIVNLLAINDGRLLEWIEGVEQRSGDSEIALVQELSKLLQNETISQESHIRFINFNHRSLVGGVSSDLKDIQIRFLENLLDNLYGGNKAQNIWSSCISCSAKDRCEAFRATCIFGPDGVSESINPEIRQRARRRLFEGLQAVHLRGETHITIRELRATLVYILFGIHYCEDYHDSNDINVLPYWDRAFSPYSPGRQGEVLRELVRFDPALESNPQIDRYLLSRKFADSDKSAPHYENLTLESARRRAYFEWTEEHINEIAGDPYALDLSRGQNLRLFRNLALIQNSDEQLRLCERLCAGISRLEDLPPQTLDRAGVVPLRITPRTPTETTFWIEKKLSAFQIEAVLPPEVKGVDRLHRHAFLIYNYSDGRKERLRLGAELFHLLLELSDGYQLGDVSTDDTFANLAVFVQRLLREDEREVLAWNPMQEEMIFQIFPNKLPDSQRQQITLKQFTLGDQS